MGVGKIIRREIKAYIEAELRDYSDTLRQIGEDREELLHEGHCPDSSGIRGTGISNLTHNMRENCVRLCGPAAWSKGCHGADHRGEVSEEELFVLAAKREGITVVECRRRVSVAMGKE